MKKLIILISSAILLASCGWQGGYRYPCQDPANWEATECNPPICEASGTCTKDLVGDTIP